MPRAKEPAAGMSTAQAQQDAVSDGIDNFELPRSLIMKLARASQVSNRLRRVKRVHPSRMLCATLRRMPGSGEHEVLEGCDPIHPEGIHRLRELPWYAASARRHLNGNSLSFQLPREENSAVSQ